MPCSCFNDQGKKWDSIVTSQDPICNSEFSVLRMRLFPGVEYGGKMSMISVMADAELYGRLRLMFLVATDHQVPQWMWSYIQ